MPLRIVVLVKPVPDTASAAERLGPDQRLDRAAVPAVVNANDEYALEAALKLTEQHTGEVSLLSMAPPTAPETLRKALAMGAHDGVHVTDASLAGSDTWSTTQVLAAAVRDLEYDLLLCGADTSDGGAGVVPAGVAALLRLPYLSYAARIEPDPDARTVRVHRISPTGFDVLEAPMPAIVVCTQALGEPRYPSLKGIMAARSKEITTRGLDGLPVDGAKVGGEVATNRVLDSEPPPTRPPTQVIREPAADAAKRIVAFLEERRIVG